MRLKPYTSAQIPALLAATVVIAGSANAADLTWDAGTSTNWNSTDANWTTTTWSNATPDSAIFNTDTGTINLTENITAGSFTFGNSGSNTSGAFSGSNLTINGNLTALALNTNGPGGPTLSFSNNVSIGGDLIIGRRVVEITGGNFTANRVLSGDSWGRLLISGGTVTATNGIDDSINNGNTFNVFLQGGSLYTPFIKTTTVLFTNVPSDGVVLNGGTLYATANSSDFIQTHTGVGNWGIRNNVGVGPAGANINTNGFDIAINRTLQNYAGAGTLTKDGAGKLTLNWSEHSGGTTVNAGTLEYAPGGGWSLLRNTLTVNAGGTVSTLGDGTGIGWQPGSMVTPLNISEIGRAHV